MSKQILFFQGGGDDGYNADQGLVNSLQKSLGNGYDIDYPELESDELLPDFGWIQQIKQKVQENKDGVIVVGHSLGASMLLRYLSENIADRIIEAVFLISTPYWSGDEEWKAGLKLKENFASGLPPEIPLFFYHCKDDQEVPYSHFDRYKKEITGGTFREMESGGHQLGNNLTVVAQDIKKLFSKVN